MNDKVKKVFSQKTITSFRKNGEIKLYPEAAIQNRTSTWVFSCKFAAYFQNTFF